MRKKKWLRRGAYFLIFLVALYLLFWWALFNPLESDVEALVALVPKNVTYLVHSPWGRLRETELFKVGFMKSVLKEEIDYHLQLEEYLYSPIRDLEAQINQSVPGFFGKFSVLDDFAGREVLLAGYLADEGDTLGEKIGNSPYLALTRISFKAKFIEVLKYGFVSDKVPGLTSFPGYFRYDLGAEYVREGAPEEARYVFFSRIRDVLAVSNNQELLQQAVRLGVAGGDSTGSSENLPGGNYWFFYDVYSPNGGARGPSQEPGVTVWLRVRYLDAELGGEISGGRNPQDAALPPLLRILFPVRLTNSVTLELGAEGEEDIPVHGKIRMDDQGRLPEWIAGFHENVGLAMRPPLEKWAEYASADRTFAFAWLGMDARRAFLTFFKSLSPERRRLWFGEGDRNRDPDSWTDEEAARRLGEWFGDGIAVALSRLPEADSIDLDHYEGREMDPLPALTFYLEEMAGLEPEELVAFIKRNHERLGATSFEEISSPIGRLFRLGVPGDMSEQLRKPAFALLDRSFIFSTNVDELTRVLEAKASGGGSLASREDFKDALARVHEKGKLFLLADGPLLRKYLLDQRHEVSREAVQFSGSRERVKIQNDLTQEGWPKAQQPAEIERRYLERERKMKFEDFPEAVEKYKRALRWMESIAGFDLSARVSGDPSGGTYLELDGLLRLKESNER